MEEGIAAWIICEDLLVKVKTELANEAIITLQKEVKGGRMKVDGKLVSPNEISSDAERDLFVANQIAQESENMLSTYSDYISAKEANMERITPEDVEKTENAKRLMMAVHEITILMKYRKATEEWILEIEGIPTINDPIKLLASTIHGNDDVRFEILDFALKRKAIVEEKIFSDEERKMMQGALKILDPNYAV
ncbi:MAG: hypothetical protein M1528_01930 [Candidatus Marsarchaeota archaeon]|jgi:hypothetical protein|nr:hypothetical protein [Candidatus Marsarchaeota archaeon]MCL5115269.1 hypothetical protein [Candidatus Marsarchaeota archaeon]